MSPSQRPLKLMQRVTGIVQALILMVSSAAIIACATVDSQYQPWPEDTRAQIHIDLARIYLARGQPAVAKEEFNTALQLDSRSDQAFHGLGLIEAQALNFDKAASYMAKAININHQNINAVGDYGILLCQSGETAKGIDLLERTQANHNKSDTVGMFLALGNCYLLAQQNESAELALRRVLQLNPTLPQALFSMAQVQYDQNQALSARAFIQRYFSTNSMSSKALLLGAEIENLLGNVTERKGYTKKLRERYPQSQAWQQAQKEFN